MRKTIRGYCIIDVEGGKPTDGGAAEQMQHLDFLDLRCTRTSVRFGGPFNKRWFFEHA